MAEERLQHAFAHALAQQIGHDRLDLAPQDREHRVDALLAERGEPPQGEPNDAPSAAGGRTALASLSTR